MKKTISSILLIFMLLSCLIACNNETSPTESSTSVGNTNTGEYIDSDGNYVPAHEVKDMGGDMFTIIVRGTAYGTYQSDDFTTESWMYGELIDDAVKKRNDTVASLYNVTLDVVQSDSVYNDVLLDCQSNLGTYDAVMPSLSELSKLASQGYLYDLSSIETFDMDAPWYDKNCTDEYAPDDYADTIWTVTQFRLKPS